MIKTPTVNEREVNSGGGLAEREWARYKGYFARKAEFYHEKRGANAPLFIWPWESQNRRDGTDSPPF